MQNTMGLVDSCFTRDVFLQVGREAVNPRSRTRHLLQANAGGQGVCLWHTCTHQDGKGRLGARMRRLGGRLQTRHPFKFQQGFYVNCGKLHWFIHGHGRTQSAFDLQWG